MRVQSSQQTAVLRDQPVSSQQAGRSWKCARVRQKTGLKPRMNTNKHNKLGLHRYVLNEMHSGLFCGDTVGLMRRDERCVCNDEVGLSFSFRLNFDMGRSEER